MIEPTLAQSKILTSTKKLNLFNAGWGTGKTNTMGVQSAVLITNFPNVRGLIAANTYGQLNKSTLFRVREVWKSFGLTEYSDKNLQGNYIMNKKPPKHFNTAFHNYDNYSNIISFLNGAIVYVGSLDNYKALDGMEIGWAMLDETKDTKEEAVKEVIVARLRQRGMYVLNRQLTIDPLGTPFNPLYVFTSPAKTEWLSKFFLLEEYESDIVRDIHSERGFFSVSEANRTIVVAATSTNQENLPENYIEDLTNSLGSHLVEANIFGNPFAKSGGEFYVGFDRLKHVKKILYDKELPLHVSFDENLVPYAPCQIWQVKDNEIRLIEEVALKDPRNNIYEVCRVVRNNYSTHESGMIIYGDATSKKGDPKLERVGRKENFYSIVKKELSNFRPRFKVPPANPNVNQRGDFINTILEKELYGLKIIFGEDCYHSIADMTYLKKDNNGKLKEVVRDKITKQSYQRYGHMSDAMDYFICEAYKKEFSRFRKPFNTVSKATIRTIDSKSY
jgi:hypothetical protein